MEEFKYIIFLLGEQKYAMNLMCVNAIVQDYRIIPVPNAPDGVKGIINLRGAVIPVYSLKSRFGMETGAGGSERSLLITKSSGTDLAYEVDSVISIEEIEPHNINRMPYVAATEDTKCLEEVLQLKDDIVISISVDEVLSEETRGVLEEIIADNQGKDD